MKIKLISILHIHIPTIIYSLKFKFVVKCLELIVQSVNNWLNFDFLNDLLIALDVLGCI